MKRLLVIINNYDEVSHNQHIFRLLSFFNTHRIAVTLLVLSSRGELADKFNALPIKIITLTQLFSCISKNKTTIVLTKELRSEYLVFFCRYILGYSLRHYTIRPSYGFLNESFWKIIKNTLFCLSLRLVDMNIAVGETVGNRIKNNVVCIPNSVPNSSLVLSRRADKSKIQFIYSGYLEPRKNLFYTLALLRKLDKPFQFIILGDGPQRKKLQDYVMKHGMLDNVVFEGHVTNVVDYLKTANVFIFMSKMEGLSLSLLEAMACGLPCIVSDVPENREVIDDMNTGLVVSLRDKDTAVSRIDYLLDRPELMKKMGRSAAEYIKKTHVDSKAFIRYSHVIFQD